MWSCRTAGSPAPVILAVSYCRRRRCRCDGVSSSCVRWPHRSTYAAHCGWPISMRTRRPMRHHRLRRPPSRCRRHCRPPPSCSSSVASAGARRSCRRCRAVSSRVQSDRRAMNWCCLGGWHSEKNDWKTIGISCMHKNETSQQFRNCVNVGWCLNAMQTDCS